MIYLCENLHQVDFKAATIAKPHALTIEPRPSLNVGKHPATCLFEMYVV